MNVDWAPVGCQPSDQANQLGLWVCRKLAAAIHTHRPIFIITQPESWDSFYHPTVGGRLSWPRHCSKGAQPVPKTVYHSSCRNKHNRPWHDSNLGPLTPPLDALITRLLRPVLFPLALDRQSLHMLLVCVSWVVWQPHVLTSQQHKRSLELEHGVIYCWQSGPHCNCWHSTNSSELCCFIPRFTNLTDECSWIYLMSAVTL